MDGTHFLFGWLVPLHPGLKAGMTIASVIIFLGAVMRMLYYLGVMQVVVRGMAYVMRRLMGVSGAESLGTAANVFVGMVESALTVRPYVAGMTRSELFTLMTAGMATVAGSVMAAYTGFVKPFLGENAGGHLVTASLISAPAAILIAKIMIPETELPATSGLSAIPSADTGDDAPVNLFDAAVRGALDGLNLAITVLGLMIAFLGLVAALNALVSVATFGHLTFTSLIGYACSPIAVGMGVPLDEAVRAGSLIGQKTVANEFVAYSALQTMMGPEGAPLTPRTALVMTYALCGFANLGSVAIMIAGIGGIAPNQRPNLARLGLLSIVGGSLAAFTTGCLAGLLG
jgi:CNT family concentrative nucleoside transporter